MNLDQLGHVAQVRDKSHFRAVGAKREADRISGIMRNLKRMDINIADGEMLAGLNGFHATQTLRKPVGQSAVQRVHGLFRYKQWRFPQSEHLRQAVAVIEVLVSDKDAVDVIDAQFDGRETRQSFAFAEATVHEESGALRLEQGNVARAA